MTSLNINARAFVPSFGGATTSDAAAATTNTAASAPAAPAANVTPATTTTTTPMPAAGSILQNQRTSATQGATAATTSATTTTMATTPPAQLSDTTAQSLDPLKHIYHIMFNKSNNNNAAPSPQEQQLGSVLKPVTTPLSQFTSEYFAQHQKQQMAATQRASGMSVEGFIACRAAFDLSQPLSTLPFSSSSSSSSDDSSSSSSNKTANKSVAPLGGFIIPLYVTPRSGSQHADKLSGLSGTLDYGWQDMLNSYANDSRVGAMGHVIKKFSGASMTYHYFFVCVDHAATYFNAKPGALQSQVSSDMSRESVLGKCRLARRGVPIARCLLRRVVTDCTAATSWAAAALCVVTEDPALTYGGQQQTAAGDGQDGKQEEGGDSSKHLSPPQFVTPSAKKTTNDGGGTTAAVVASSASKSSEEKEQREDEGEKASSAAQPAGVAQRVKTVHIRVPVPHTAAAVSYAALQVLQSIEDQVLTVTGDAWEVASATADSEAGKKEEDQHQQQHKREAVAVVLELRQSVGENVTYVCSSFVHALLRVCIDAMVPVVAVAGFLPECMAIPGALPKWMPSVDKLLETKQKQEEDASEAAKTTTTTSSSPADGAHSWWCRQALAPRMVAAFDGDLPSASGSNSSGGASSCSQLTCERSMGRMYDNAARALSCAVFGADEGSNSSSDATALSAPILSVRLRHPHLLNKGDHPFPMPAHALEPTDYAEELTLIHEYVLSHLGHAPSPANPGVVTVQRPPTQRLSRSSFVEAVMPFAKDQYLLTPAPRGIDVFLVVDTQGTVYVCDAQLQSLSTIVAPESAYWQGEQPLSAFPGTILRGVLTSCSATFGTPTAPASMPCKVVVQDVLVVMDSNLTLEPFDTRWRGNVMQAMGLEDARSNAHFVPTHGLSVVRANYFTQREARTSLLAGNELHASKGGFCELGFTAVPLMGSYFPLPGERVDAANPPPPSLRYTWRPPDSATALFAVGSVTPLATATRAAVATTSGDAEKEVEEKKEKEAKEGDEGGPASKETEQENEKKDAAAASETNASASKSANEGAVVAARASLCVRFQHTQFLEPYNGEFADFYVSGARSLEPGQVVECLLRRHDAGSHWWEILREFSAPSEYLVTPMRRRAVTTEVVDPFLSVAELTWLSECSKYLCHQCGSVNDHGRCDNSNGRYYCVACWEMYGEGHCAQCHQGGASQQGDGGEQQQQPRPGMPPQPQRRLLQSGLPMVKGATDKTPTGGGFYCHGCWAVFMLKLPNNVTWAKPRHVDHYLAYCAETPPPPPAAATTDATKTEEKEEEEQEKQLTWVDALRGTDDYCAKNLQEQEQQQQLQSKRTHFSELLELAKGYFLYAVTMTAPCAVVLDLCAGCGDALPAIALLTAATRYIGVDVLSRSLERAAARSRAVTSARATVLASGAASDATKTTATAATSPPPQTTATTTTSATTSTADAARVPAPHGTSVLNPPTGGPVGSPAGTHTSESGAAAPPGTTAAAPNKTSSSSSSQSSAASAALQQCTFLPADCFCGDFYSKHLPRAYGHGKRVHLVTCFDGIHNAFGSAETLRTALHGIGSVLCPNGIFVGFALDARKLAQLGSSYNDDALKVEWKQAQSQEDEAAAGSASGASTHSELVRIGNSVHIRVRSSLLSSTTPTTTVAAATAAEATTDSTTPAAAVAAKESTQFVQNVIGIDTLRSVASECHLTYDASWSVAVEDVATAMPPLLRNALTQQSSQPGANSATLQAAVREAQSRAVALEALLQRALAAAQQSEPELGHLLAAWNVFVFRKVATMNTHQRGGVGGGGAVAAGATGVHQQQHM